MIVINEPLLAEFRTPGPCDYCGHWCRVREPAHIEARGMGGGSRLDVRINLVALGSTRLMMCRCHDDHHAGKAPFKIDLYRIVAARENTKPWAVESVVRWLLRLDKHASPEAVARSISIMRPGSQALARRVWEEVLTNRVQV